MISKTYDLTTINKIGHDIEERHRYLLKLAIPDAIKQTLDAVAALARTKAIRYIKGKAKTPRWAIARKFPKNLQRKANKRDFLTKGTMSAKNHVLTGGITYASLFGTAKSPRPSNVKMESLKSRRNGVKAPGQPKVKEAFVADGRRRVTDASYERRLRKSTAAGPPVLKGNHYQVMRRTGKEPYPLEVMKVDIKPYAGRALDSYTKRSYQANYGRIFERQLTYNMKHKVKF